MGWVIGGIIFILVIIGLGVWACWYLKGLPEDVMDCSDDPDHSAILDPLDNHDEMCA